MRHELYTDITENCSRCTSGALDSFLRFEVDDAGIGINESNRKSLFDACSSDRNIVGKKYKLIHLCMK